jgi:hypothetical protein
MRSCGKKSIAHHEAGHVVAHWDLTGRTPTLATIEPSIGNLGHVDYKSLIYKMHLGIDNNDNARLRVEQSIMIKLAGPIAQKRYSAKSLLNYHASPDWLGAVDIALRLNGSEHAAMAYVGWLEYRTADLIEYQWQNIKRVAAALLRQKTLSKGELQKTLMPAGW